MIQLNQIIFAQNAKLLIKKFTELEQPVDIRLIMYHHQCFLVPENDKHYHKSAAKCYMTFLSSEKYVPGNEQTCTSFLYPVQFASVVIIMHNVVFVTEKIIFFRICMYNDF